MKAAEPPVSMHRLLLVFWSVTVPEGGGGGLAFTVCVAAVVVAGPAELVNTARYRYPFWDEAVLKLRVVEVEEAPEHSARVGRCFNPKLELATTGAEPGLHHGDLLLFGNHLRISGESRVGFIVSGLYLAMEFIFLRHNNCCLHWIEKPRTARIVRGWTRRATNSGRTARNVAPANAERLAALHRSSNRPRFEYCHGATS